MSARGGLALARAFGVQLCAGLAGPVLLGCDSFVRPALEGTRTAAAGSAAWGLGACVAVVILLGWMQRRQRGLRAELAREHEVAEEQARRLEAFVDATSDLVLRYGADGRVRQIDPRGQRLLGLDTAECSACDLRDFVEPRFLPLVALSSADAKTGRTHWGPIEVLVKSRSGEDIWLLVRMRAVPDPEQGHVFELVGTNVTPQKTAGHASDQATEVLRELAQVTMSRGTLSEVLESVARGLGFDDAELWRVDEQFEVLRLDDAWRSAGLPPVPEAAARQTLGKGSGLAGRAWALGNPLIEPQLERDPQSSLQGGLAPSLAATFRSGLAFPVQLAGELVGVVALRSSEPVLRMPSLDLLAMLGGQIGQFAQRIRAEERLRSSEARNRAILECTIECVITANERGEILDFNPAAERTFGHARADVLGKPVEVLIVPPELREQHAAAFAQYLETGERRMDSRIETLGLRADGTQIPIELAVTPIRVGGKPVVTAFLRDISHRKEIERLKDELVSTVSHELRTPLASVRGFVELLLMRDYPPAEQKKFLGIVDSELRRLTRLINDFLDLQRLEGGTQVYETTDQDLLPLLQECLKVVAGSSAAHVLQLDVHDAALPVRMDADRIQQVLMNLLSNAVKFSPEGGQIVLAARIRGDSVETSVRDSGLGMAPEVVEKLFSKFYRADSSATRKIQGTGLGLALVREIVTAHGGDVRVESEPGVGSSFSFTLPLGADSKASPSEPESAA